MLNFLQASNYKGKKHEKRSFGIGGKCPLYKRDERRDQESVR